MVFVFTLDPRGLIVFCTLRVAVLTGVDVCFIFHVVCGCSLLFVCDCWLSVVRCGCGSCCCPCHIGST